MKGPLFGLVLVLLSALADAGGPPYYHLIYEGDIVKPRCAPQAASATG